MAHVTGKRGAYKAYDVNPNAKVPRTTKSKNRKVQRDEENTDVQPQQADDGHGNYANIGF
jgi:hypothetical protein